MKANYLTFLTTMVAAPLLYVPGNHDGHYLRTPPEGCDDLTERMAVIKGVRFIGFGGAHSAAPSPFTIRKKTSRGRLCGGCLKYVSMAGLTYW